VTDKTSDSDRQGLDDIEPLEDNGNRTVDRQEPEDDYYIRNYVLKDSGSETEPKKTVPPQQAQTEAATVTQTPPPAPKAEPEVAKEVNAVETGAPAFGMRTFTPEPTQTLPTPGTRPVDSSELTREESLTDTLSDLLGSSADIEAAMLVSLDGLAMASALPETMQEDKVAAMSAAILGLGERASAELGRGELKQVFVEGKNGYVFLMSTGGKAVLTALAQRGVKIGLVFYDMKLAARKIADIL